MRGREVLFEFAVVGDVMRCVAVDAETGVEAIAVGPAHGARAALEAIALRKLGRALGETPSTEEPASPPTPVRPGKLA